MSARLSLTQIAVLFGYALGMTGGQMLFKLAALRLPQEGSAADRALGLLQDRLFSGCSRRVPDPRARLGVDPQLHAPVARLSVRCICFCTDACARRLDVRGSAVGPAVRRNCRNPVRAPARGRLTLSGFVRHARSRSRSAASSWVISSSWTRSFRCRLSMTSRLITTQT